MPCGLHGVGLSGKGGRMERSSRLPRAATSRNCKKPCPERGRRTGAPDPQMLHEHILRGTAPLGGGRATPAPLLFLDSGVPPGCLLSSLTQSASFSCLPRAGEGQSRIRIALFCYCVGGTGGGRLDGSRVTLLSTLPPPGPDKSH